MIWRIFQKILSVLFSLIEGLLLPKRFLRLSEERKRESNKKDQEVQESFSEGFSGPLKARIFEPPEIQFIPSPNRRTRTAEIELVVLHYTAAGDIEGTISWFRKRKARVSAHYLISRKGRIVQLVRDSDVAWHAGRSYWQGRRGVNNFSIGIELCNWGKLKRKKGSFFCWPNDWNEEYQGPEPFFDGENYWEPYTQEQYLALLQLLFFKRASWKLQREKVVGHCDVAPLRKVDPGPAFRWELVDWLLREIESRKEV